MKALFVSVAFAVMSVSFMSVAQAAGVSSATSFSTVSTSGSAPMFEVKRQGKHAGRKAKRMSK